ncbi:CAMK/CAMKL/KIN4 protein kinase [Microbotryum lychnidis-dioicae p1A1 Lamole]|uniref:non-specific serine/threonine protein kinase n=1 Tax=Microbotryum lychnidis-dioicae (strain p1A1 Lamole / MvSl-1064) TaxID=683840 RepID=U5H918_USTV1|nr:CAMK/CAMKL/KIN4 protein kinase [Microbotryum lychnidis-dioicae p1A1 Lamole]|eukprot:KDE05900.1 CAMK/CAMKL/KIN4 protein kinase [Microbotryum lychnidis-dioicae p1A1 Lamole]
MTTPSAAYPFSPSPSSPEIYSDAQPSPDPSSRPNEERRRSKRESTANATRQREEAATRYPSPPPGNGGSAAARRPVSIDASLVIPPFNPNNRRQPGSSPSPSPTVPSSDTTSSSSRRSSQVQELLPPPQPSHHQYHAQRPMSVAAPVSSPIAPFIGGGANSSGTSGGAAPPPASAQRVRQSVGYLPTSTTNTAASLGPYPQLYTPHPMPRQKIFFGPYILLQTLGEGEFGKVKLGVHSERWGEDVAIKLIKRGNVDTAQRGEKVRREIEVLKSVRHPNIVRLYDVIETDKYIGIVLEYASGGELFDHILAHRYLKERDASRLFAQLISGVGYLHAKGIVHRDLKLENLLLDRNRNVQITDFGFANRFEDAGRDLMATSCGSPCYAAPELVVQEGKYVGTAVDVWSCGVILYAMLAGYLPYDDDPTNPEGDNINLLYKYIINTPLTFPEWITAEPRELLLLMLVPDPIKRCTIEDVMRHSWLRKFAAHFERTVAELEKQAQEQELWKRQALEAQRQFLVQQYAQQQAQQQQQQSAQQQTSGLGIMATGMTRSHTSTGPPSSGTRYKTAMAQSASQQTGLDTHAFPTTSVQEEETPASAPVPIRETRTSIVLPGAVGRRAGNNSFGASSPPTTQTQRITVDADHFTFEPRSGAKGSNSSSSASGPSPASVAMTPSFSAPPDPPSIPTQDDLMVVDMPRPSTSRQPSTSSRASRRSSTTAGATPSTASTPRVSSAGAATSSSAAEAASQRRKASHRATVQVEYDSEAAARNATKRVEVSGPATPAEDVDMVSAPQAKTAELPPTTPSATLVEESKEVTRPTTPPLVPLPTPSTTPSTPTKDAPSCVSTPKKRKNSADASEVDQLKSLPSAHALAASKPDTLPAVPSTPTRSKSDADTTPRAKKTSAPTPLTEFGETNRSRSGSGRFSLRGLLPGPTPGSPVPRKSTTSERSESSNAVDEAAKSERRKSRRQKAMSLQPFKSTSSKASKAPSSSATISENTRPPAITTPKPAATSSSTRRGSMGPPPAPASSNTSRPSTRSSAAAPVTPSGRSRDLEAAWASSNTPGSSSAPGSKAKSVMDWFRRRSTRAPGPSDAGSFNFVSTTPNGAQDGESRSTSSRRTRPMSMMPSLPSRASSQTTSMASSSVTPFATPTIEPPPAVVLTPSTAPPKQQSSPQSSRSVSGGAQSLVSSTTTSTKATTVSSNTTTMAVAKPAPAVVEPQFVPGRLRVHQGALDKHALTYRSPPEVMVDIRNALWKMGVEMVMETDFRVKCVRKSRKKAQQLQLAGLGFDPPAATSTDGDHRELLNSSMSSRMSASPSMTSNLAQSPSMSFRGFFARKTSGTTIGAASSALNSPDPLLSPAMTPCLSSGPIGGMLGTQTQQPAPIYGEGSSDSGDEVRFHVEITRVKHLERLYCVDLKRVKGSPWSYKHVYDQLLGALELGPS